jgi:hypothetical protein
MGEEGLVVEESPTHYCISWQKFVEKYKKNIKKLKHCSLNLHASCLKTLKNRKPEAALKSRLCNEVSQVTFAAEPVFLNVYGAPESIPRNEFFQPM